MANVLLLTTTHPGDPRFTYTDYERLTRAAGMDRVGLHRLVDEPARADVILFVGYAEHGAGDVRRHRFAREWREKVFVFDSSDSPLPLVPGVFVCTDRRWYSRERTRGGFYLRTFDNDSIRYEPLPGERLLFSFVGRVGAARVRGEIVKLRHPRAVVRDVDAQQIDAGEAAATFFEIMRRSAFVLCPRGIGTATWRLFETMKAGRVPVIVSDDWVPPAGPHWERFSLRVRERDVAAIPRLLEEQEARAEEMGLAAREAWLEWGAQEAVFHRIVEWCLDIQRSRTKPESLLRFTAYPHLLRPFFFRHVVLGGIKRWLRS